MRLEETRLDELAFESLQAAMLMLRLALDGECVAVLLVKDDEPFFYFQPGLEKRVAQVLGRIDYAAFKRLIEEHVV